ncbi:c-type cytochrome [Trichloromonas sp.]|uniref:c-type cytochrome n=1 Tax=Trichloromonas sp. TaxID=3069249 RepID=UPI003D813187
MTRNTWLIALAAALAITTGCSKEEAPPAAAPAPVPTVEKTVETPAPKATMEHVMDKAHEGVKEAHEAAQASMATGQSVYEKTCAVCHNAGVAGAPKLGDKAAWAAHITEGVDHLVHVAIAGEGTMPAKGGDPTLSDEDVRAAVIYILDQSR